MIEFISRSNFSIGRDKDTAIYLEYGKSGDAGLFKLLFDKYKIGILNMIIKMANVSKTEAEDILQDVFFKIIDKRKSFKPNAKFSTWLYKIAYNRTLNYLRDKKPENDIEQVDLISKEQSPIDNLIQSDIRKAIRNALAKLAPNQRNSLVLREYADKSYDDISKIMQLSKSSVESLIFHARQNMRKLLKGIK